jgi:hypothetical protein
MTTATATKPPAVIESGAVYGIAEFRARTGWGRHAVRAAKRRGLPVRYECGRAYIVGSDFLNYIAARGAGGSR